MSSALLFFFFFVFLCTVVLWQEATVFLLQNFVLLEYFIVRKLSAKNAKFEHDSPYLWAKKIEI